MCVVPCPCLLCRKQHTCCLVPTSQPCSCMDCVAYFQDHSSFHGTFHFGCRSCYQIAQIFPVFNFFFLNNEKKKKPCGSYYDDFSIKPIIVNLEPKAPKSWLDFLPASVIIERHAMYAVQGMHCIECDIFYWSRPQLIEHIERNHMISRVFKHHFVNTTRQAQDHECKDCKQVFVSSSKLNRHVESVHLNEKFTCHDCGKQFTRQDTLLRHIKTLHENVSSDKPKCEFCETTFNRDSNLQRHLENILDNDGNVKYECKYCEEEFCTANVLATHCSSMHVSQDISIEYKCYQCLDYFGSSEDLNMHIDSVHIQETHICDVCNKTFSRADNLIRHRRIKHSSQKFGKQVIMSGSIDSDKFKCELCTTTFTIKTNLLIHMKNIYNSDKTVKNTCDQCEEKFCTGKQLKAHIVSHQTTFSCERCQQTFTQKRSLDLHMKTRRSCNQCENSFCNMISIKKHMKEAHGIQTKIIKK